MEMEEKVARMQEIERRGLLDRLSPRQRAGWEEYKRRHNMSSQDALEFSPEALAQIEANNRAYDDKSHLGLNVVGGFVSGMGEGNLSGIGRLVSGATFGASDWLDRKTGGNLAALDDRLQRRADNAGVGTLNKVAKAGTEIVGNIAPGATITRGLAKASVKSALAQSALGGGVGGSLYGATNSDKLSDLPVNMLAGGIEGTITGTALHGAFSGIGTVGGLFRNNLKKGMDYIRKTRGDKYLQDMIDEATQKGTSLAEVADERGLDMVQMARQQTPDAKYTIHDNIRTIEDARSDRANRFIDDMLGSKSGFETVEDVQAAAKEQARPIYESLQGRDLAQKPTREQLAEYPAESNSISDFDNPLNYTLDEWLSQPRKINLGSKNISLNDYRARNGYPIPGDDVLDKMRMPHGMSGNDKRLLAQQYEKNRVLYDKSAQEYKDLSDKGELPTYDDIVDYAGGSETSDKKIAAAKMAWKKAQKQAENKQNLVNQIKNSSQNMSLRGDIPVGYDGVTYTQLPNGTTNNIPSIGEYVNKNPFIQAEISKVRQDLTLPKSVREASDTSFDILNAVKKSIDDKINVAKRQGENELVSRLTGIKNELVNQVDSAAPEYAEARKIYENAYRFEEAADLGKDVFNNASSKSPERFTKEFNKLSNSQKEALKLGLRDELKNIINGKENPELGWKRVINENAQQKIKRVLGKEEGEKLIAFANSRIKGMRNLNTIKTGSQTSEKQYLRDVTSAGQRILDNPTGALGTLSRMIPWNNARNRGIAQIMTNPSSDLARATYEQVASPRGWEAVYQALYDPRGLTKYNTALAAYLAGRELQQ